MTEDNRIYWIWLAETFGQGSRYAALLANRYRSARNLYDGVADNLDVDEELNEQRIEMIRDKLNNRSLDAADRILSRCESLGINVIPYNSEYFPSQLRMLPDAPIVLYVRGKLPNCTENMLTTIVGTRTMTEYGRAMAYSLGAGLAYGGSVVVSGMALGTDSMGMLGALDAGGRTIAVLGSGADVIYPKEHKELYYKILDKGAVISEYAPGTPPVGTHFPIRNRIMSGLSDATVVVEANQSSGSMITARLAISQGKKLFAVPGKVGEDGSEGTNLLIGDGAMSCVCAEDILTEFEFIYRDKISVAKAHSMMRNFESLQRSADAMAKMRIGTSYESRNYYGNGSYGGRARTQKSPFKKIESKNETEKSHTEVVKQPVLKEQKEEIQKNYVNSVKIDLDTLDENELKVYNIMKPNVPMLPDELVSKELNISTVLSALTMLEMCGAVESGGGGYFMRVVPDDIMQSEND